MELLFTSYLVVTAVAMLVTGWVSSRIGGKRTLVAGLVLIVAFSALAGASNTIGGIIGFRAGWGLGNALFIATSLAVIIGAASGGFSGAIILYETALGVGIALGPLVGGELGGISWRSRSSGSPPSCPSPWWPPCCSSNPRPDPPGAPRSSNRSRRSAAPRPGHHEPDRPGLQLGVLHPARLSPRS